MERLRTPFLLLALVLILVTVLIEMGSLRATDVAARLPHWITGSRSTSLDQAFDLFPPDQKATLLRLYQQYQQKATETNALEPDLQGFGAGSLRFVDGFLLFTLALMSVALVIPASIQARIQGVITLIFAIVVIIVAVVWILAVVVKLLLMVALLLSIPFGTLAYLIIFGSFPRSAATAVVSLLFILRVVFAVLLVAAHQRFLENTGLVLYTLAAFVASLVVSFLYALVPGFLVSITDAIAAIIVAVIGIILAIILLVGAILSILAAFSPQFSTPDLHRAFE